MHYGEYEVGQIIYCTYNKGLYKVLEVRSSNHNGFGAIDFYDFTINKRIDNEDASIDDIDVTDNKLINILCNNA